MVETKHFDRFERDGNVFYQSCTEPPLVIVQHPNSKFVDILLRTPGSTKDDYVSFDRAQLWELIEILKEAMEDREIEGGGEGY